jgi:hypothetical protein
MSSGLNLQQGSNVTGGDSPLKLKRERQEQEKIEKSSIVDFAKKHSLNETAENFLISKTSVAKLISPLVKKGKVMAESLLEAQQISEIEEVLLNSSTSSVKKIAESTGFDEAEIRIVKASLLKRGREEWQ